MVLVIDNYDSFTYNLVDLLGSLGTDVSVRFNDAIRVDEIEAAPPEAILLSPGPGLPAHAGVTLEVIRRLSGRIPILGVCLGHQAVGQAFGARLQRAPRLMHGRTSPIVHTGRGLFAGVPCPFEAMRYHSWVIDPSSLGPELELCAWTAEGEVMAIAHRALPIVGVQFHPESFMSEHGPRLVGNFLAMVAQWRESLGREANVCRN